MNNVLNEFLDDIFSFLRRENGARQAFFLQWLQAHFGVRTAAEAMNRLKKLRTPYDLSVIYREYLWCQVQPLERLSELEADYVFPVPLSPRLGEDSLCHPLSRHGDLLVLGGYPDAAR